MGTSLLPQEITRLLRSWSDGNPDALGKLAPLVEAELKRLARRYLRRERDGHTLQPTALVNEAYVRLLDRQNVNWQSRAHFIALAADMMRSILVDYARRRRSIKRGRDLDIVSFDEAIFLWKRDPNLVDLDDALKRLSAIYPRKGEVVVLRFFGGLTVEEVAEVMRISPRTVKSEWSFARAWLHRELAGVRDDA